MEVPPGCPGTPAWDNFHWHPFPAKPGGVLQQGELRPQLGHNSVTRGLAGHFTALVIKLGLTCLRGLQCFRRGAEDLLDNFHFPDEGNLRLTFGVMSKSPSGQAVELAGEPPTGGWPQGHTTCPLPLLVPVSGACRAGWGPGTHSSAHCKWPGQHSGLQRLSCPLARLSQTLEHHPEMAFLLKWLTLNRPEILLKATHNFPSTLWNK